MEKGGGFHTSNKRATFLEYIVEAMAFQKERRRARNCHTGQVRGSIFSSGQSPRGGPN